MEKKSEAGYGISLIAGSLLMVVTMILHPAGGSLEHLFKITTFIVVSHSLALVSLPFILLGFWGLTKRLEKQKLLSDAGFITMLLGIFAVMCAAATNGLALPLLMNHFRDATPEAINSIKPIITYNTSLNQAFDFIYIGALCGSVSLFSVAILKTGSLPKWTGYFGIILSLLTIVAIIAGFTFVNLTGFRIFALGFVSWIVVTGINLRRPVTHNI